MAIDPTALNPDAVAGQEAAAQQLGTASMTAYGTMPNPELAYEALQTNATAHVTSAINSGDPSYRSVIASSPAGQAPLPAGTAPTVSDPSSSVWNLDWKAYWKGNADNLRKDENSSWRSFGEVPQLNFAYMDGVRNHSDPKKIQQWQGLLKQQGFYADPKQEVSGVWDAATEAAFSGFMISRALPVALHGKDEVSKNNAALFLNGLGVDPAKLEADKGQDPTFTAQVASQWMKAQGPDSKPGDTSSLDAYANAFGAENLPQAWQNIQHEGFMDVLRGGLHGLLGWAPGVGHLWDGAVNVLTGNVDFAHMDKLLTSPEEIRSGKISDQLSASDKALLDPALQQVKGSAGFLGFMSSYSQAVTKTELGIKYMIQGIGSNQNNNPFDPLSAPSLLAEAHKDNMTAGLFGDQWAHDHPTLAMVSNVALGIAGDPLTWAPGLGEMTASGKAALGLDRTANAIRGAMSADGRAAMDSIMSGEKQAAEKSMLATARGLYQGDKSHGLIDALHLFGETNGSPETLAAIHDILTAPDQAVALDKLTGQYGHVFHNTAGLINRRTQMALTAPAMEAKMGSHLFGKLRTIGGFKDDAVALTVKDDPIGAVEKLQRQMVTAGMDAPSVRKLLDPILIAHKDGDLETLAFKVQDAIDGMKGAYEQSLKAKGLSMGQFDEWRAKMRAGRTITRNLGDFEAAHADFFAADPATEATRAAGEVSTGARSAADATAQARLAEYRDGITAQQNLMRTNLTRYAEAKGAVQGTPEWDAAMEEYWSHPGNKAIHDTAQNKINQLREEAKAFSRPAPFVSTQLANEMSLPWSTYEMAAFRNPALRKLDAVQSFVYADALNGAWKRLALGRIATSLRVDIGEDATRAVVQLAGSGHVLAATKVMGTSLAKALGTLVPGVRGRVVADTARKIEEHGLASSMQTAHKYLSETEDHLFGEYLPRQRGYSQAATWTIENLWHKAPEMQAFIDGGPQALEAWYRGGSPPAREMLRVHGATTDAQIAELAQRNADLMGGMLRDPAVRSWVKSGKVDQQQMARMVKSDSAHQALPAIAGRVQSARSENWMLNGLRKGPEMIFHHVTEPMVNSARAEGYLAIKKQWVKAITDYHGKVRQDASWTEARIDAEAHARALDWIKQNTYQGGRSVMGSALRNVTPFWGATSSMDRFWLRQATAHPVVGEVALRTAAAADDAQRNNTGHMEGLQGMLAHLGFTGGDALSFNPAHAFFLSSDGTASFVPGLGPVFAPIIHALAQNQQIAEVLQGIPGLGQQIDLSTGAAQPMFPWLGNVIQGAGMAVTGHDVSIPLLTQGDDAMKAKVDAKLKQRSMQGQTVTADDVASATREVGREMFTSGALQFALPIQPSIVDQQAQNLKAVTDQWRLLTNDTQKDTLISSQLGVTAKQWSDAVAANNVAPLLAKNPQSPANLLAFFDRRVSSEQRDQIANASPWVMTQATSEYQTTQGKTSSVQEFTAKRASGDINVLTPQSYIGQVQKAQDINTAWLEYYRLKQAEYSFLADNGLSTSDTAYKQWKAQSFDPAVMALQNAHPLWRAAFAAAGSGGTDAPSLAQATAPLRALMSWEVIPQHSDFETAKSVLWRNVLVYKDTAANEIASIMARPHKKAEVDAVMQAFSDQLGQLSRQDPNFAAELGNFTFGKFEDVVNLQADEIRAGAPGYSAVGAAA